MATITIPTPLRRYTNNAARVTIQANNVSGLFLELTASYPELKQHLFDADGRIISIVSIFVGNDDIRSLEGELTEVNDLTVVSIVPAIAGGIR